KQRAGKGVIKCKAAMLWEQKNSFSVEETEVAPSKAKEVCSKTLATGICWKNEHMTKGTIVSKFPVTVGHEATGVVESIGEGVTMVKPGVTVIPVFLPQCRECNACRDPDVNLCVRSDVTGHGVLADGTTRFTCRGKPVYHFTSTSTFTEYTVVDETSVAKIDDEAHPEKELVSPQVTRGSTCVAFGLGRVGLLVIMGCKSAGASRIIGIDLNKDKFEKAVAVRATKCISPKDSTKPISEVLSEMTGEASLVAQWLRSACQCRGHGVGVVVGAPLSAKMLTYDPVLPRAGCTRKGCVFGGWESRDDVPKLVTDFLEKKFDLDQVTTHVFPFKQINEGFELLYSHQRFCLLVCFLTFDLHLFLPPNTPASGNHQSVLCIYEVVALDSSYT
uniref:Alcohol dehydrogenase 7 (class IV), mu or sigma polypeptide n=1 Tax=Phocoena sinus TaxID=42100 RepID=A0A8C9CLM2_PHOSS